MTKPENDKTSKKSPAPPEPPPEPPEPVIIEAEDKHKAEKTQLQLMCAVKDETIAQMNLGTASRARAIAMEYSTNVRLELEKKYNINLMTHQIRDEDGAVVPVTPMGGLVQKLQGLL